MNTITLNRDYRSKIDCYTPNNLLCQAGSYYLQRDISDYLDWYHLPHSLHQVPIPTPHHYPYTKSPPHIPSRTLYPTRYLTCHALCTMSYTKSAPYPKPPSPSTALLLKNDTLWPATSLLWIIAILFTVNSDRRKWRYFWGLLSQRGTTYTKKFMVE